MVLAVLLLLHRVHNLLRLFLGAAAAQVAHRLMVVQALPLLVLVERYQVEIIHL
jgi:hypothetical protein